MKIHSLLAEILIFLFVSLFFVFPPIFGWLGNVDEQLLVEWTFPLSQIIFAIFSIFLYLLYHKSEKSKVNVFGVRIIFTICLLFTSSFFLNFLALTFPNISNNHNVEFSAPDNFIKWIFCILNFICSAFFEEVIYRFYFSDSLLSILKKTSNFFDKKIFKIICEIIGCLVFAFAHSYLGLLPIVNAAIAHFILRYVYKKSGSIFPGVIAHFIYNVISLILL